MTEHEAWLEANDKYLTAALAWLRARLSALAAPASPPAARPAPMPPPVPSDPVSETARSFWDRLVTGPPTALGTPVLPPAPAEEREATPPTGDAPSTPPPVATGTTDAPALILLAHRLGLSPFEAHTLLLCSAMELDTGFPALCARAQNDPGRPYPTFALALSLFENPAWDVMSPERPLRYWRLVEISQVGPQPLITSALRADERIVNFLKGLNYLDDRLGPLLVPVPSASGALAPSQRRVAEAIVGQLTQPQGLAPMSLLQLVGADRQSKLLVAQHAVERLGLRLYRIAADVIPTQTQDHETLLRLWQRESALIPVALYVDAANVDRGAAPQVGTIQRLIARAAGTVFLDTREPWADLGRETATFEIAKPTPAEQHAAWRDVLGEGARQHAERLAGHFNLNLPAIRQIAAAAPREGDAEVVGNALWTECVSRTRPTLDMLAQALPAKASWSDLKLPAAEATLLRHIVDHVRQRMSVYDGWGFRDRMNRGLGISALFAGPSGTGKKMAAEVIANELGLPLHRIDLSAVVSKYIGDSEKNLRRLFDAAEDGGAILFFDEADALFGKRSEVKDSHDRYANIEVNYLLQRMEAYAGLAILATNMKSALDQAFLRRLRFIVNFPFPGPAERQAIWQSVFPRQTPTEGLDWARLARLSLTGGSIHNIALSAAFLAARSEGRVVTMPLVLQAARIEFRKLDKPVDEAEFRWLVPTQASA